MQIGRAVLVLGGVRMVYGVSRFAGGRGAFRRARDAARLKARDRARNGTRILCATLLVVTCLVMVPGVALAETDWHERGSTYSATVAGYSYPEGRPYALAEFLGYDWGSLSTSVRQSILTANNNDNPFQSALTHVKNVQYETNSGLDWPIISIWSTIFGLGDMWDIEMSNTLYTQAKEHMEYYMYPRPGTSVNPGVDGDYYVFSGNVNYMNNGYDYMYLLGGNVRYTNQVKSSNTLLPSRITVKASKVKFANFESLHPDRTKWALYLSYSSGKILLNVTTTDDIVYQTNTVINTEQYIYKPSTTKVDGKTITGQTSDYTFDGTTIVYTTDSTSGSVTNFTPQSASGGMMWLLYGGDEVVTPPYEPQPDTPTTPPTLDEPTTPDLPTTNAPTTPDSTPTNYVTQPNVVVNAPTYNTFPTGTSADYSPWLDEIVTLLRKLNDYAYCIEDDMNTWFYAISQDIRTGFDNVLGRLSSVKAGIHADLVWLADNLDDWITDAALYLATYLHDVTEYLSDLVGEYDSQFYSIINWLRRIYSRLGGTGATKPDPTLDEPGFWDWLVDMFRQFFSGLLGGAADTVGGLFSQLAQLFPFSLPWDLMYILGLLAHEPVTPVFDLPLPVPDAVNSSHRVLVHVDCSAWNGVATAVRAVELIFFAYGLARMVPEWFNTIKVSGM